MRDKPEVYVVWERSDGYIGASVGMPRDYPGYLGTFTEIMNSEDWSACASRLRAERVAVVMNEDLFPIAESAQGNRVGVTPDGSRK